MEEIQYELLINGFKRVDKDFYTKMLGDLSFKVWIEEEKMEVLRHDEVIESIVLTAHEKLTAIIKGVLARELKKIEEVSEFLDVEYELKYNSGERVYNLLRSLICDLEDRYTFLNIESKRLDT